MKSYIKIIILTIALITSHQSLITLHAQVGINDNNASPDASAMLDVKSTTKGMLIPRMTTAQRSLINSPATGLMIYNTTDNQFNYYNGTAWEAIGKDNLGDHKATQNIQTNGNWINGDNDNEGIKISNTGQVSIGKIQNPTERFQVGFDTTKPNVNLATDPTKISVLKSWLSLQPNVLINNTNAVWAGDIVPNWIKYDMGAGNQKIVQYYTLTHNPNLAHSFNIKSWTFEGSNDGTTWTVLDTRTNHSIIQRDETFGFNSTTAYRYYRLNITASISNGAIIGLNQLQLFESISDVNHYFAISDTGAIRFHNNYTFPKTKPTQRQILKANSTGDLEWSSEFDLIQFPGIPGSRINLLGSLSYGIGISSIPTTAYTDYNIDYYVNSNLDNHVFKSFTNGVAQDLMRIQGDGKVGIGRTPASNLLEVNGDASKVTAGNWLANSDARLKKDITPLLPEKMLNDLLELQGVTYEWNDTTTGNDRPTGIQYGFTAQNIQTVFPTLVNEDNLGYLQTAYGTYDAMTVEAIRALNDKIERLEEENESLKTQVAKVEKFEVMLLEMRNNNPKTTELNK